jgi:hypothetical protein
VDKYWICVAEDDHRPFRHSSKALALAEAERLAGSLRKQIAVLEVIDGFQPVRLVERVTLREVDTEAMAGQTIAEGDIPF